MTLRARPLLLVSALALLVAAASVAFAAFRATSTNAGNAISSGTVALGDNDGGGALVSFASATPGTAATACIKVSYTGSLASAVRLYGETTGTGLDAYLDLVVTRGVYSPLEPAFRSCANFVADPTNYIGAGAGVVYSGTLRDFPDAFAGGLVDPTASAPESWAAGEARVYRIAVTLRTNVGAEGLNATQVFTWEARNT